MQIFKLKSDIFCLYLRVFLVLVTSSSMHPFKSLLPSLHLLCSAPWPAWMSAPQGEAHSFRNDLPCQPGEDKATGQYAAV